MLNVTAVVFLCGLALISAANSREEDVLPELQHLNQLSPMALEFAERFQDLKPSEEETISEEDQLCLDDLAALTAGLQRFQMWALKMMDSWGSTPSGQLTGNLYDLGNFDECLNIRKEISKEGSPNRTIQGKYCFRSVYLAKSATCIPASCSAVHMKKYMGLSTRTGTPSTSITINDSTCQTSEREPWDGLTIFMIVILSVLATLVALFTLWDYFLVKNQDELPAYVKVFSARVSSRALFRVVENKSNPNVIDCLHGIRCMSLIWVVFGHQYISSLTSASINLFHIAAWETTPFASFILNGFYSVDSFFMLGGLLVSLITLRLMDKTKGKLNVPMMYLHRIIRIVPLLGMAILIYMTLMPVISGGPLFVGGFAGKANCEKNWYLTLLFVNNWTDDLCLGHTWYLSLDMQLFLISPILLITLHKWGKKVAAAIFVLIILLSGCLFATMMVNDYSMTYKNFSPDAMRAMYFATHTHATPWLIGFLFGYFLYVTKGKKFLLNQVAVWSGWILCLAMLFTSIFALYPAAQKGAPPLTTLQNSFYYTLTRLGWSSALCWVVFACMQGYGGLANSFLSTPLWQPLSRLSYSVYIWHMFIQEVNARNVRTNSYFSDYSIMVNFWSSFGFTLLFSYIMYLLIEAPFGALDQFMRPKTKNPPVVQQKSQIDDNAPSNLEELQVITPTPGENEAQK
ncbi:nose resistant to fluoxetine protein 6-like [Drosophila takahashii]|uniref:nose resistant to fluoxetine protein 6-like n=1 Tax=Drosophila takahashii TaxID=29030 RepID=UPI001CF90138|nr:nose resistant to fluoxetine protein 6-like [Drosophila takahashii]